VAFSRRHPNICEKFHFLRMLAEIAAAAVAVAANAIQSLLRLDKRPPSSKQQIVAPSVHVFTNSILLVPPTVEGKQNFPSNNLPNWGDPNSNVQTNSNGPGCCEGVGKGKGVGIGPNRGPGIGPGENGVGTTAIGTLGVGVGVRAPTCLYCPKPEYSDEARKVHFQGLVELSVVVQADGKPGRIELVTGPGMGLDEKTIEAVRNWRFRPAIAPNGKAIAVTIPIEVQFQLF